MPFEGSDIDGDVAHGVRCIQYAANTAFYRLWAGGELSSRATRSTA
jgi:hypothetical protein